MLGDGLHGTPIYDDAGDYHFINGNNLFEGRIVINEKTKKVSETEAHKHRKKLCDRTILVSINGTLGNIAFYRGEKVILGKSACYFNVEAGVDKHFVGYVLKSDAFQSYIHNLATGSTIKNVSLRLMRDFSFQLPPFEVQSHISGMLKVLDDRITLLRETNATLEAIAQALFKSWFVDFDPVRAKQEGRAPEGMSDATAALFPDRFEESELGLLPKGWRISTVADLCSTITNGGTPSRSKVELWEGGTIPWFKTGEFNDGFLLQSAERITRNALATSAAKLLPENSVLMAIYAAPTVGRLGVLTEPSTFNQACTGMVAKETVGVWFLFWTLYFGRDWFNSRANGAAQQNISKAIVSAYRVVSPSDSVLLAFNEIATSIHHRIRRNSEQAQTLATLRDTLLPRLISGQLRLPEAEALIEEATA